MHYTHPEPVRADQPNGCQPDEQPGESKYLSDSPPLPPGCQHCRVHTIFQVNVPWKALEVLKNFSESPGWNRDGWHIYSSFTEQLGAD